MEGDNRNLNEFDREFLASWKPPEKQREVCGSPHVGEIEFGPYAKDHPRVEHVPESVERKTHDTAQDAVVHLLNNMQRIAQSQEVTYCEILLHTKSGAVYASAAGEGVPTSGE